MSAPLIEQKRAYLRAAVDALKEKGVTQRAIADRMDESEGAFSGRLSGQRGLPDDYIDRFAVEFKIPYAFGDAGPTSAISADQVEEMLQQGKTTVRLLSLVLDRVEASAPAPSKERR